MNNGIKSNISRARQWRRVTLFILIPLLVFPVLCCDIVLLLDSFPSSWLPSSMDFSLNIFEGTAHIKNNTAQILYVTAMTTTYGKPQIITQNVAFKQRDIPIKPQDSIELHYDAADFPLAGIVVCKNTKECRLLPVNNSGDYELNSYENLEKLETDWLTAVQAAPPYNYGALTVVSINFVLVFLFAGWVYWGWRKKRNTSYA